MRAAVYARFSGTKDDVSLEQQAKDGVAFCRGNGWELVGVFVERGKRSAWSDRHRPQWDNLIDKAVGGEVDVIVAREPARLSRSERSRADLKEAYRASGVLVAFWNGSPGVPTPPKGVEWGIRGLMDEDYAERVSDNQKNAQADRNRGVTAAAKRLQAITGREGAMPPRRPTFGYHRNGRTRCHDDCTPWTVNEDEAAVIREAARRYLDGETLGSIVRDLDGRGVRTARGNSFTEKTLKDTLKSPTVAGYVYAEPNPEHPDWPSGAIDGCWEPILDRDTHNAIAEAARSGQTRKRERTREWALAGMIRCAECDGPMLSRIHHSRNGHRYLRYRCDRRPGRNGCGQSIDALKTRDALWQEAVIPLVSDRLRETGSVHDALDDARAALDRLRRQEAKINDEFFDPDGLLSREQYRERMAENQDEQAVAKARVERLEDAVERTRRLDLPDNAADLVRAWLGATEAQRRTMLRAVIRQVTIHRASRTSRFERERIEVEWLRPFADGTTRTRLRPAGDVSEEDLAALPGMLHAG